MHGLINLSLTDLLMRSEMFQFLVVMIVTEKIVLDGNIKSAWNTSTGINKMGFVEDLRDFVSFPYQLITFKLIILTKKGSTYN